MSRRRQGSEDNMRKVLIVDYIPGVGDLFCYNNLGRICNVLEEKERIFVLALRDKNDKEGKENIVVLKGNAVEITDFPKEETQSLTTIFSISGMMREDCIKSLRERGSIDLDIVLNNIVKNITVKMTNQAISMGLDKG